MNHTTVPLKDSRNQEATTPEYIQQCLSKALGQIDSLKGFETCALLDYPDYLNLGDRAIWIGSILALTDVLNLKINYAASVSNFSKLDLDKAVGKAPIFLNGGGNLGDLWPKCQDFRETIISQYRDRPIVILPQSIYFINPENLKKTAAIFNTHPDLTLFVRDRISYDLAINAFDNCRILLAPDMAFQMVGLTGLPNDSRSKSSILYLCRDDRELDKSFSPSKISLSNLVVEDWKSYQWLLGTQKSQLEQNLISLFREGWQRGLATPGEWIARQRWEFWHPNLKKMERLYQPAMHHQAWSFLYSALYQLSQHRFVITNRLHAHILCIILGIPHIFLPNAYHKNEAFYETWTHQIPFCKFVKDPAQIGNVVRELEEGVF